MLRLRLVLILIGFTAVTAQIVLMRELLVLFSGAEISLGLMLASWLLWTAAGSGILGRFAPRHPERLLAALDILIALALPLTILAARLAKAALQTAPGEMVGPGAMLAASLIVLGPFCVISGWLFSAGSRMYAMEANAPVAQATGSVYLLEAAGSGAGGFLASLVLIRYMDAVEIALIVAMLNLAAAAWLLFRRRRIALAVLAVAALIPVFAPRIETVSLTRLWRPFDIIDVRNSVYGNIVLAGREGSLSLYENGLPVFTAPGPEAAEKAVHYALLEHAAPKTLLLIGGGAGGGAAEALKHPTLARVDYVELDPEILRLAEKYKLLPRDPRLRIHNSDGRFFLKTNHASFDVIIVNLPDPQTAQLNRFYTVEFFREAARRLSPGGVLSFGLTSSENYLSPERAAFFRCIHKTLDAVFPEVRFLPGGTLHFFASNQPGTLVTSTQALLERLRSRKIQTSYVSEAFLPFELTPDRIDNLATRIRPLPGTPLNRDFAPIAYYFDVVLWSTSFSVTASRWLSSLAGIGFGTCLLAVALAALVASLLLLVTRRPASVAGCSVLIIGFTTMGLEVLLLLGFQAVYGYVYHQLAILIAMFMAGMALGSWRGLRARSNMRRLALLQTVAAAAPLALCLLMEALPIVRAAFVFPVLAFLCGLIGGNQFPVASRIYFSDRPGRSPGALYALDLAGSCFGALLIGAFLIPLFGFRSTAVVMAVVCLTPALPAWVGSRREPGR
jgi:spermidine synthase